MNSKNQILNLKDVDRLVDGSLHGDEYRKVIQQIDATPNGWKQCAMVFLESQALAQDLEQLFSDPHAQKSTVDLSNCDSGESTNANPGPSTSNQTIVEPMNNKIGWFHKTGGMMFVVTAASILISFGLGIYANGWLDTNRDRVDGKGNNSAESGNDTSLIAATLPLLVHDADSGENHEVDVPIVNSSNAKSGLATSATGQLPQKIDDILRANNKPYEVQRNLVPVRHPNGKVYSIPIDQYRFKNSNRRYQ